MVCRLVLGSTLTALFLLTGCSMSEAPSVRSAGGELDPSLLQAPSLDVTRLAKTDDCATCHADVASHWTHSSHAYASFDNPWYRASVDRFRAERGHEESRFCAGCHDPLLLLSGAIDAEVRADDDLAYAGITCLVCHSVESARPDGNASFTLTDAPVLIPDPASPAEIEAHRTRLSLDPLRTADLCGTCHRSFSGPAIGNEKHLPGIDDVGDWASSGFSGAVQDHLASVEGRSCQGCHMSPRPASEQEMAGAVDGTVRSHRFFASHTSLGAQLPDPAYLQAAVDALEGSVIADVGAVRTGARRALLPREAEVRGGERLVFDVLLQNAEVGHRFPGGVRDLHDTWVEVEVHDAAGELLGASKPDDAKPGAAFVLRATMLDHDGNPEVFHHVDRFAAPAFDRTLDAHAARAVRYSMTVPEAPRLPLRVDVRLMHRKHNAAFVEFACEASRTERGRQFAAGAELRGKVAVDPCGTPPKTEVGSARVWMGRGAQKREALGGATRPTVERLLTQGRALLEGQQEHAYLAGPSIARAQRLARADSSPSLLARAFVLRARLAGLEGRPRQARSWLGRAEALVGEHPTLDRVMGDAYARVWQWKKAAIAYGRVVAASPGDPAAWRRLARAHGSLGHDAEALQAAEAGLALAPNDEALLRSRALALESMAAPGAEEAKAHWLSRRSPDAQPMLLATCERAHDSCRRDRQPIPHYTLTPPTKAIHARVDPG